MLKFENGKAELHVASRSSEYIIEDFKDLSLSQTNEIKKNGYEI